MTVEENHSQTMEGQNTNFLEIFPCAKRDSEARLASIKYFICLCLLLFVLNLLAQYFLTRTKYLDLISLFITASFFSIFYTILMLAPFFKRIRRYTVDYQNNIIADIGSNQEIIPSGEIAGVELLDHKSSFEFIKSSKLAGYIGMYKTELHGTIKACAVSRDHFVLIKTKMIPNYVISPKEPEKFVEFMTGRLRLGKGEN